MFLSSLRMSSRVTLSLLNNPPWITNTCEARNLDGGEMVWKEGEGEREGEGKEAGGEQEGLPSYSIDVQEGEDRILPKIVQIYFQKIFDKSKYMLGRGGWNEKENKRKIGEMKRERE